MVSSSATAARMSRPFHAARISPSRQNAKIDAAVPAFMSATPRPWILPSSTAPLKGSRSHAARSVTGNVSRWPFRIIERPGPLSMTATTLASVSLASITSGVWPAFFSHSATQAAAARVSPGGFSLGRRISSVTSVSASC
jgi:hypothetical protein